jgi:subtilisin-like proprotein convertase family protein
LAEAALDCSGSNNTQQITINDAQGSPQPATPYPSVQFVTGLVGQITKITVMVKGFNHADFNDVGILIQSPSGTVVELMRNVGGTNTPFDTREFNLVFDDAAVNSVVPPSATSFFLPGDDLVTLPITIYRKPTQGPSGNYPLPAPQVFPFQTTLAAFIGELPNGCWSLWVCDFANLDSGYMLFGFEVD